VRPTKHGLIAGPTVIVTLCMAVLGMLLWANMTEKCASFYGTEYGGLLMIFKALVCMMWIGLPITVWSLCSYLSRPEEYHTIPDEAAGANSEQTPAAGAEEYHTIPDKAAGANSEQTQAAQGPSGSLLRSIDQP
jgi:hypothetical protein